MTHYRQCYIDILGNLPKKKVVKMVTVTVDYPDKTYCAYDFETMEEAKNWASNMYSPYDYTVYIEGVEYVK